MSDELLQLQQLLDLANEVPKPVDNLTAGVWDQLVELIKGAVQKLLDSTINPLKTTVGGIVSAIKDKLNEVVGGLNRTIAGVVTDVKSKVDAVKTELKTAIEGVVGDVLDGVNEVLGGVGDAIKQAIGWIRDKLAEVVDAVKGIGKQIGEQIAGALANIVNGLRQALLNAFNNIADFLGGIIDAVGEWIGNVIEGLKGTIKGVIDTAKGWIIDQYNHIKDIIASWITAVNTWIETARKNVQETIQNFINLVVAIKDRLVSFFWETAAKVGDFLAREVLPRFEGARKGAVAIVEAAKVVWDLIAKGDYQGAFDLVDKLLKGIGVPAPVQTLHAILSTIAYFWQTVSLQFVPMQVAAAKRANINLALDPVSLDAAAVAVFRGKASAAEFYANAALAGNTKDRAEMVLEASRALPTPGAIQQAYLRGEIREKEHDELLRGYGYTKDNIELFKALYVLIPTPQDLIRMGVREVFTPEVAQKFGQFEDFPKPFADWAAKIGINEQWAKNYWAAHWELPSATMGFEMLHRGVIDDNELKLLLRALDVMPYWRERLIQISYNPLTRVDIRRMFQAGVLNKEQVTKAYLDLGYDQQKAGWLTEFTIRYYSPEDQSQQDEFKSLARSTYSQAYKRKLISKEEYTAFLINLKYYPDDVTLLVQLDDYAILAGDKLFELGDYRKELLKLSLTAYDRGLLSKSEITSVLTDLSYEENEIALELSLLDYNRELKLRNILVEQLHDQYVTYIIDLTQLHTIMDMFGFVSGEIDRLQEEWDIERNYRAKRPPLSDLRRFFNDGLISLGDFLDELRGQGYNEKYITLYEKSLASA